VLLHHYCKRRFVAVAQWSTKVRGCGVRRRLCDLGRAAEALRAEMHTAPRLTARWAAHHLCVLGRRAKAAELKGELVSYRIVPAVCTWAQSSLQLPVHTAALLSHAVTARL
jgi:hypothetical protein